MQRTERVCSVKCASCTNEWGQTPPAQSNPPCFHPSSDGLQPEAKGMMEKTGKVYICGSGMGVDPLQARPCATSRVENVAMLTRISPLMRPPCDAMRVFRTCSLLDSGLAASVAEVCLWLSCSNAVQPGSWKGEQTRPETMVCVPKQGGPGGICAPCFSTCIHTCHAGMTCLPASSKMRCLHCRLQLG
jgi:hypothetical protein